MNRATFSRTIHLRPAARRASLLVAALAALLPGVASAQWTASGTFEYTDRLYDLAGFTGTTPKPVREADVEVFDTNSLAILGSGSTNASGAFSIAIADSTPRDVGVRVIADSTQSATLVHRVVDDLNSDAVYSYQDAGTNVAGHDGATNVDFGTMTMPAAIGDPGVTDWSSQIFNLYDLGVVLADWIEDADGARPPVPYSIRFNPNSGRTGSFYNGGANIFSCSDDDAYDDPNVLHELGHYIEDEYGESDNTGGAHFLGDDDQDPRLAWSEGWATFVSNASLDFNALPRPDIYCDRDSFGVSGGGGFAYSLEAAVTGGSTNELAVNAALYDMIDTASTADASPGSDDDPMGNQQANIWTVLETFRALDPKATQTEDFWDVWFDLALGSLGDMETTFVAHSIDFLADAQEPNDLIGDATALTVGAGYQENTFYRTDRTVGGAGDEDWFTFNATAGTTYVIEINGAANSIFGRPNPEMFLIDATGEVIVASSNDPFDASNNINSSSTAQEMSESVPSIIHTATASGPLFAYVRHDSSRFALTGRYGTYQIRVRSIATPNATITDVHAPRLLPGESYPVQIRGANFATNVQVSSPTAGITLSGVRWIGPDMLVGTVTVGGAVADGTYAVEVTNPGTTTASSNSLTVDAAATPFIAITELDPGNVDAVELKNTGSVAADLTGFTLRTTFISGTDYVFPSFTLAPGATVVVSEASGTDTATELFDGANAFNWLPGSEGDWEMQLIDTFGVSVDYARLRFGPVGNTFAPTAGGIWFQPEQLGPVFPNTMHRNLAGGVPGTTIGFGQAAATMPAGAAGRDTPIDAHEENDSPRDAPLFARNATIADLSIHPMTTGEDEDWFGFLVPQGSDFQLRMTHTHADGDLDLELYAPGEETTPLASSTSTTDNEIVEVAAATTTTLGGGIYRARVFGKGGATNPSYSLEGLTTVPVELSAIALD